MTRAFPYLRPPRDVVRGGTWSRLVFDGSEELPDEIPEWDYDSVLALRRLLKVDGLRARRLADLTDSCELDLTVRWSSTSSALRGRAWRMPVPPQDDLEVEIEFDLDGDELGGVLELATLLTLRRSSDDAGAVAATRPGSVLWSDRRSVNLQGDVALFPLALADFRELPYPSGAGWFLEVGQDLEAAALGSVLLLANERREVVAKALVSAGAPSEADRRVLSVLRSDVLRTLVERALADDDFVDDSRFPAGSLGALLQAVLRTTFPEVALDALRRERSLEPAIFNSRVQDASGLLADP